MRGEQISVNEAAKVLGMAPYTVRYKMRQKTLPIGYAYPPDKNGKKVWEYRIYQAMLNRYLGKGGQADAKS